METPWIDPLVFATACLGGGGLLLSLCLGLVPRRRSAPALAAHLAMAIAALSSGLFAILAAACRQPASLWASAGTLTGLYLVLVGIPALVTAHGAAALAWSRTRPARLGGMLALWAICPFSALGLVYAQIEPPAILNDAELATWAEDAWSIPMLERDTNSPLTTDRGRCIPLLKVPASECVATPERLAKQDRLLTRHELHDCVIYVPGGWQHCNCHGYVFTGGQFCLSGQDVDAILEDNGYQPVSRVQANDVAVYRDSSGRITHTGIVRGLAGDQVILVESKWGLAGRFIHPHDRHPYNDHQCTFYRSPRAGHLVHGDHSNHAKDTPTVPQPETAPAGVTDRAVRSAA